MTLSKFPDDKATETTLDAIKTAVEILDNAISGSEMQVDIVNTPTVTANLSATDNAVLDTIDAVLDTIKVDTEAIETAVEIMDDWDDTDRCKTVEQNIGLGGSSTEEIVALTNANTFYAIPSTAPTNAYQLKLQLDGDGDFYFTFENGGTAGTDGIIYTNRDVIDLVLAGNQQVYVATKTAGDDCRVVTKEVV